jgi:hypothetical protein
MSRLPGNKCQSVRSQAGVAVEDEPWDSFPDCDPATESEPRASATGCATVAVRDPCLRSNPIEDTGSNVPQPGAIASVSDEQAPVG